MPFELIRRMGVKTQEDLCVIAPSSLEELEDNIDSALARAILDCRKFEDARPDNPAGAIQRLNENGFASIQNASIDDIGSFTLRGFNLAHLIVMGEITTYTLLDLKRSCPDSLRLLLETRSSNALQLLPIELAALTNRHSTNPVVISTNFYADEFATSLFSQALQAHCVLSIMNVVDVTRLLYLSILRGNTSIIKYILSVYSQFGVTVSFRDLIITNDMHTLSIVNIRSLSYLMSSKLLNNDDADIPLYYVYDTYGLLPIHLAALNGRLSCVLQLLQYDKGMINVLTKDTNINLLNCAISSNSTECVAAIIGIIKEIGGEAALREQLRHRFGQLQTNALALAILYNNRDVVSLLIRHAVADDLLVKMLPLKVDSGSHMQLPLLNAFAKGCSVMELLFYTEQYHNIYSFMISRSIAEKRMLFREAENFCKPSICGSMQMTHGSPARMSPRKVMQQGCCMNNTVCCVCTNSLACKMLNSTCSLCGIVMDCLGRYTGIFLYVASLFGLGLNTLFSFLPKQFAQLLTQQQTQSYTFLLPASLRAFLEHRLCSLILRIGTLVLTILSALFFALTRNLRLERSAPVSLTGNEFVQSPSFSDDVKDRRNVEKNPCTCAHSCDAQMSSTILISEPRYQICDIMVSKSLIQPIHCSCLVDPQSSLIASGDNETEKPLNEAPIAAVPDASVPKIEHLCMTCLRPEQGTYCYLCSMCVCHRIFHSHILNFCISHRNVYTYAISMGMFYLAWILFLIQSPFRASRLITSFFILLFSYLVLLDIRE